MNSVSHYRNVLYLDDSLQLLKEQKIELTSPTQKLTLTTPCNYSEKENELTVPTQKHTVPWWLPATTERLTHAPTQRNLPCRFPATTWRKRINSEPNYRNLLYLDDSLQLLKEKKIELTTPTQKLTLMTLCNYPKEKNELSAPLQKIAVPWWLPAITERKKLNSLLQHINLPWQLPATTRRKIMNSVPQHRNALYPPYLDESLQLLEERE